MLLWILLSMGLALGVVVGGCILATISAERRTRRHFYASLGFDEDLISVLMTRKGPVSTQLALVRQAAISGGDPVDSLRPTGGSRTQRSFRFRKTPDDAGPPGLQRPALAPVRRKPPPGRDHA